MRTLVKIEMEFEYTPTFQDVVDYINQLIHNGTLDLEYDIEEDNS